MQIISTGNRTSGITCAVDFANKIDDDIKIIFSETQHFSSGFKLAGVLNNK